MGPPPSARGLRPGAEASPVSVCATLSSVIVPSKPSVRAARSLCGTECDCRVEQHLECRLQRERHTQETRVRG